MNQYIKSIIEGFNFGNVKGNASQNITKVLQKEISIKNLLVNKYKISDDIVTNEYVDEIYEDKDSQGYNYLYISYYYDDSEIEADEDSVTDVGSASEFYDNICLDLKNANFKRVELNGSSLRGLPYYIISYPLQTDKDINDFTVDDYLKYCKHYSDEDIEKMYQDELEHSGDSKVRRVNIEFEYAYDELKNVKYFYNNQFKQLNDKEREAVVRYARNINYLSVSKHTIYISPDDLLFIKFEQEEPEQKYDSNEWVTNIFLDAYFLESILKINHDWLDKNAYERTYNKKYEGWHLGYTTFFYYNNRWKEMHGDRINDFEEYKEKKNNERIHESFNTKSHKQLFESLQSNLGEFIQELNKVFDVKLHNYNPREKGRCLTYITVDTFDENNNDFKELMDKFQVFISSTDKFDAPDGTIQVCFESKYPEDVTKYVYKNSKVLYHLTRPNYLKQISEEGLKPVAATEFRKSWYPARVYLLTDRCTKQDVKTYARQLGTSYIIICDIEKMGDNYDFYKDPQSLENFSVFTDKPIPKECIQIMSLKDFYKL